MPGRFLNSLFIFNIAKGAALRAASGSSVTQDVLIAIVFSVVSAEAFINELVDGANDVFCEFETQPDKIKTLNEVGDEIEQAHGSLKSKYLFAKLILSGKSFDKGTNPFQDFALLVDVRNAIVHHKVVDKFDLIDDKIVMQPLKLLERLDRRKLLSATKDASSSWFEKISNAAMARWACESTAAMVTMLTNEIPEGSFKETPKALSQYFTMS